MWTRVALGVALALLGGCDDGSASGLTGYAGDFEILTREARSSCDEAEAWTPQAAVDAPFFRLADIDVVGSPLLGYFECGSAESASCGDKARLGLSYGQHRGGWYAQNGDLRSTAEGCALTMRAGPLVLEDDGLSLVVSHFEGVLPLGPDTCTVDVLEARYDELPCLDQTRWTARRLR